MKIAVYGMLFALTITTALAGISQVKIGSTEDEVYAALGAPQGEVAGDGYTILFYDGGGVEMRNGKVARIDPKFGARAAQRDQAQTAQGGWLGKVSAWAAWARDQVTGGTASPQPEAITEIPPAFSTVSAGGPIQKISEEGAEVDIARLVVPGQVTIVDFFADWCGPCKRVAPRLDLLARQDGEVYLRKVDIVRWGSDVAMQYGISSIPHIRVYNRDGQMVGNPTSDFNEVVAYVASAK